MQKIKLRLGHTFWKWLATYLIILVIPVSIMIFVCLHALSTLKQEVVRVYSGALTQLQATIDGEFNSVHSAVYSISADSKVQTLAYTKGDFSPHHFQSMRKIQQDLQKYISVSSIIEGIYLYFPSTSYALGNMGHYNLERLEQHFQDTYRIRPDGFVELLGSHHYQKLVTFEEEDGAEQYLFLLHSVLPIESSASNRALVVFALNREELRRQMTLLNHSLDSRMEMLLYSSPDWGRGALPVSEEQLSEMLASKGYTQLNRKDSFVLSVPSQVQEVHYFTVVSLDSIRRETDRIQLLFIVCILLCLLLGVAMAYVFSRKQYRPLEQLTRTFRERQRVQDSSAHTDEYHFLAASFHQVIGEMEQAQSQLYRQRTAMRRAVLNRILMGRFPSMEQAAEALRNAGMEYLGKEFIVLAFLTRDDSRLFYKNDIDAQETYEASRIIIQNISEELVNERFRGYCTEIDDKSVVVVCKPAGKDAPEFLKETEALCRKIVRVIAENFNLRLICAVSDIHYDAKGIAAGYSEVLEAEEYVTLVDSDTDVVSYRDTFDGLVSPAETGTNLAERCAYFVSLIRDGDYIQANRNFGELIDAYLPADLNNLALAKCRVFGLINQLIIAFEDLRGEFSDGFYNELDPAGHLLQIRNFNELKSEVTRILDEITHYYLEKNPIPAVSRVEQIQQYIKERYADPNLSAAMISESFDMKPAYLSRLFKKQAGTGVLDYIHEVRGEKAKELMTTTNDSIKSISERVGYYNSLTFIRAFKRIEGCTPGHYREERGAPALNHEK